MIIRKTLEQSRPGRYFFVAFSMLFLIIALIGFIPSYQDDQFSGLPPIHWLANVHGALMTSWLLVFITQSVLAAKGRFKFHRKLGVLSLGLGSFVWISMWVASGRALMGFNPPVENFMFDVLANQFSGIVLFGTFFLWGMIVRKKAAAHKRLLFLATLVLMQAAIDRTHWLPLFGLRNSVAYFLYLDALLMSLFIYDWATIKRIHKITMIGALLIIVAQGIVMMIWGSPTWHTFWFNLLNRFR